MELTVENMCGLLIRSRLLTPDGVRTMYSRWQGDAKSGTGDVAQFGKWLVANHFLTAYQSALLARGQADCFFLNEYKILDRIGQGRMAGVYKALHHLGQAVAVKVLPPSRAKDVQLFARFQRESRLALCLRHPNIVRAFQVGETNGLHYIVMELLDGETLEDVLTRRGKLLPGEAVRLMYQLLQGLQHIHEQGLVHRDLKPSNLMLVPASPKGGANDNTFRCTLKILDIGLGRALFDDVQPAEPDSDELQLTGEGVLLGTPDYLAPEQARDAHKADIRSDIYSVGCVLYHLLTGQPPFPDTNIISQMVRHATEPPKPMRELNPAVPEGLQQVVGMMLGKNPAQRYQLPTQAAQALQPFLSSGAEVVPPLDNEPTMRAYLKWVDEKGKGGNNKAAPPVAAIVRPAAAPSPAARPAAPAPAAARPAAPVAAVAKPAVPVAQPVGTPPAEKKKRSKHRKKRKARLLAKLRKKKAAAAAAAGGVELVPVAAAPVAGPGKRFGLSVRDWTLLGVGAGSVILVAVLGMLLARGFSSERPAPEPDGTSESP